MKNTDFSTPLQTRVPGISFTCQGRVWFRVHTTDSVILVSPDIARAISLSEVYTIASDETSALFPDDAFEAEQKIAIRLADWHSAAQHCGIELKAMLSITLAGQDATRAEQFNEARRAAHLDQAISRDRMTFLREVALQNETTAQLWWLQRNIESPEPETSWQVFDKVVRPLISNCDSADDPSTKFAKTVVTLVDRIHDNPDRLGLLTQVATALLNTMGWPDLADELATLAPHLSPQNQNNQPTSTQ